MRLVCVRGHTRGSLRGGLRQFGEASSKIFPAESSGYGVVIGGVPSGNSQREPGAAGRSRPRRVRQTGDRWGRVATARITGTGKGRAREPQPPYASSLRASEGSLFVSVAAF